MKKVAVFVCSRPNYGRLKSVLKAINNNPELELQLFVGISASYEHYECMSTIINDGFKTTEEIKLIGNPRFDDERTMPTIYGLFATQLPDVFHRHKPDVVLVHADRYEMEAIAYAADCMNLPVAHTQGGEITGSIDDNVRFAISMHSKYHFPATEESADRLKYILLSRGKSPHNIYNVGCPSIDLLREMDLSYSPIYGDYVVVLNHGNTRESGEAMVQTQTLMNSVRKLGHKTIWIGNNVDIGAQAIEKTMQDCQDDNITFVKSFCPEDFYRVIKHSKCLIGNTSAGLREGAWLGVPYLCLGTRQTDREHGDNVMFARYDVDEICEGVDGLYGAKFDTDYRFGNGTAGKQIADILGGL